VNDIKQLLSKYQGERHLFVDGKSFRQLLIAFVISCKIKLAMDRSEKKNAWKGLQSNHVSN